MAARRRLVRRATVPGADDGPGAGDDPGNKRGAGLGDAVRRRSDDPRAGDVPGRLRGRPVWVATPRQRGRDGLRRAHRQRPRRRIQEGREGQVIRRHAARPARFPWRRYSGSSDSADVAHLRWMSDARLPRISATDRPARPPGSGDHAGHLGAFLARCADGSRRSHRPRDQLAHARCWCTLSREKATKELLRQVAARRSACGRPRGGAGERRPSGGRIDASGCGSSPLPAAGRVLRQADVQRTPLQLASLDPAVISDHAQAHLGIQAAEAA